jgi:hypothetical protein
MSGDHRKGAEQASQQEIDRAWHVAADGSRTNDITGEKQLPPERAPVQGYRRGIPWSMHLDAYDAYVKGWSRQDALIDYNGRGCRGGFGTEELDQFIPGWREKVSEIEALRAEVDRLKSVEAELTRLKTERDRPETANFLRGVELEAEHQRARWGADHDAGKLPEDWVFLLGYLATKACCALKEGNTEKALHHTISSGAAMANWHLAITGVDTAMRPGIDPVERKVA